MQLELASIKAALTGTPLREEQPVETNLDSSPVEEHIPPAGTTLTADFNSKPATSVVGSNTESATPGLIGPGVSDEGRDYAVHCTMGDHLFHRLV